MPIPSEGQIMRSQVVVALIFAFILTVSADGAEKMEKYHKRKAKDFLEANSKKEGVQVTDSGLQYKIIRKGTSNVSPMKSETVEVHYRGTLIDGKQFDASYDRGQPSKFGVGQVISGWTEGLQLMHVGDKFEFYIPSELGYGARGSGRNIPPHSALIFEVELLGIEGKKDL